MHQISLQESVLGGGFLIVSFVIYKMIAFFYYKNKLSSPEKAVLRPSEPLKQSDDNWDHKSDDNKVKEMVLFIIIMSQKHPKNKSTSSTTKKIRAANIAAEESLH